MNVDALFITVPKGEKPQALPPDQYEFTIDRSTRKIVGLMGIFGQRETLRVQTNRPFEIDVRVELPDRTLGSVRAIPCGARVQGQIERNQDAARRFLEAALGADFKMDVLVSRLLQAAIAQYAKTIQGEFVHLVRQPDGPPKLHAALVQSFLDAGFPATHVTVAPVVHDQRATLTFDDAAQSLPVRSVGTLESHRVGYKVRLKWGTDNDRQVAGRLTYAGAVEGRTQGASLSNAAVAGQTQPLEHWLRTLLVEALSREEWSAVVAGDEHLNRRVVEAVSLPLGHGTGRVVDTLVIYPVVEGGGDFAESTTKFTARYAITGVKGEGIEVEHAIRYSLVDRDRWKAQGSPDPQVFFKQHVGEAAKSFLVDKRFEDVVALFLDGSTGERRFRDGIASRVGPAVKGIGYRLDAVATILAIPEMDFIHGRSLRVPERGYGLADPHVEAALRVDVNVKVRQREDGGALFARALAMYDDFHDRVLKEIEETVRACLRNISALSYYSSPYVNGLRTVQDQDTGELRSLAVDDRQFKQPVQAAINESLTRKFGLEVTEFNPTPGQDRLIQRMGDLTSASDTYHFEIEFARGEEETAIKMRAMATLYIGSIAPEHWSSFYHNANRLTLAEHKEKIRVALLDTLRLTEGIVVNTPPGRLQSLDVKEQIVQLFMRRMRDELGLVVRLFPLQITVVRPAAGHIAHMEIAALKRELAILYTRRAELIEEAAGYRTGETRAQLTQRIEDVKRELDTAGRSEEANLERTQTVRIEQDPRGQLIDARPQPGSGGAAASPPP